MMKMKEISSIVGDKNIYFQSSSSFHELNFAHRKKNKIK